MSSMSRMVGSMLMAMTLPYRGHAATDTSTFTVQKGDKFVVLEEFEIPVFLAKSLRSVPDNPSVRHYIGSMKNPDKVRQDGCLQEKHVLKFKPGKEHIIEVMSNPVIPFFPCRGRRGTIFKPCTLGSSGPVLEIKYQKSGWGKNEQKNYVALSMMRYFYTNGRLNQMEVEHSTSESEPSSSYMSVRCEGSGSDICLTRIDFNANMLKLDLYKYDLHETLNEQLMDDFCATHVPEVLKEMLDNFNSRDSRASFSAEAKQKRPTDATVIERAQQIAKSFKIRLLFQKFLADRARILGMPCRTCPDGHRWVLNKRGQVVEEEIPKCRNLVKKYITSMIKQPKEYFQNFAAVLFNKHRWQKDFEELIVDFLNSSRKDIAKNIFECSTKKLGISYDLQALLGSFRKAHRSNPEKAVQEVIVWNIMCRTFEHLVRKKCKPVESLAEYTKHSEEKLFTLCTELF